MSKATTGKSANDFFILGPTLARGNRVLESIHALYYLPENYKLVFAGSTSVDKDFYGQVVDLIERDEVGHRVRFTNDASGSDLVITPRKMAFPSTKSVTGSSAEAIASAILKTCRKLVPVV